MLAEPGRTWVLMHLSDLHFGAHDPQVCAAVQRLTARLPVDVLVVSGDLTQRATRSQFAQAHAFIEDLAVPHRLVLAGNHDLPLLAWWLRWGRAYDRFLDQFGQSLEPCQQVGPFSLWGVNTTRPWRHERGSLSQAQIERVQAALQASPPEGWRIVVSHHPLVARHPTDRRHRPQRADAAVACWHAAGAHMLLSGHVHDPALLQPRPGLWALQSGTTVSHRLRHGRPNSLAVLRAQACPDAPGGWDRYAMRWDYDAAWGEFRCVSGQVLPAG